MQLFTEKTSSSSVCERFYSRMENVQLFVVCLPTRLQISIRPAAGGTNPLVLENVDFESRQKSKLMKASGFFQLSQVDWYSQNLSFSIERSSESAKSSPERSANSPQSEFLDFLSL